MKTQKRKRKKEEVLCAYPVLTWKSSGSLATLSSDETDKEGDLESWVLPETFDEMWEVPKFDTA